MKARTWSLLDSVVLVTTVAWLLTFCFKRNAAVWLVREDGPLEWLQFCLLLLAGALCIVAARRIPRQRRPVRWVLFAAAIGCLFVAGEEISWGQRLLDFRTPDVFGSHNRQGEATLHNLWYLQRLRHWPLGAFGLLGLLAIRFRTPTVEEASSKPSLTALRPPAQLALVFLLILTAAVFREVTEIYNRFFDVQAEYLRFASGRFGEFSETWVPIAICWWAVSMFCSSKAQTV